MTRRICLSETEISTIPLKMMFLIKRIIAAVPRPRESTGAGSDRRGMATGVHSDVTQFHATEHV